MVMPTSGDGKNKPIVVIGDVSGHDRALVRLLNKLPEYEHLVFVGDLVDRGSGSKECMDLVMQLCRLGKATWIVGNHEHMMVDFYRRTSIYGRNAWHSNGGAQTWAQLQNMDREPYLKFIEEDCSLVFHATLTRQDGTANHLYVTHAPVMLGNMKDYDERMVRGGDERFVFEALWNRDTPTLWRDESGQPILTVHGHNGYFHEFKKDGELFSVCVDNTRGNPREIKALVWPDMQYISEGFSQDYLPSKG